MGMLRRMTEGNLKAPGGETVRVQLEDNLAAPEHARRATGQVLRRWGLTPLLDSVLLAVSELVGNAVRHGAAPVKLTLSRLIDGIRIDVHDADPREPRLPAPPALAAQTSESGRGLQIVSSVAAEVGVEQIRGDGKMVYARFVTEGDEK